MTHAPTIRRLFAIEHAFRPRPPMPADLPARIRPAPGEITLITGPSGGGKSSLLAALRDTPRSESLLWIEPSAIRLPDACVIDCICQALGEDDAPENDLIERALELLGRVGLAEAWTYLQKPADLSDGQRWRLMLAMGVATAWRTNAPAVTAMIAMDEFAALLDRITARVVARALRRLIRSDSNSENATSAPRLSAIVATSHDDLADALAPDRIVTCDFDEYVIDVPRSSGRTTTPSTETERPRTASAARAIVSRA